MPATATADYWATHARTHSFYQWMLHYVEDKAMPQQLFAPAIHESGHLLAAVSFNVIPIRTRIYLDERGYGRGGCLWYPYPSVKDLAPRQRAIIGVAGATAARMFLDEDNNACIVSPGSDLNRVTDEGFTVEQVMPDAVCLLKRHVKALGRFAVALADKRDLTAGDVVRLLGNHSDMATLRDAFQGMR